MSMSVVVIFSAAPEHWMLDAELFYSSVFFNLTRVLAWFNATDNQYRYTGTTLLRIVLCCIELQIDE
eukprot:scaffold16151_cov62-Attheya_sp.AAC.2